VVDPVDLRLAKDLADLAIQADRARQVAPERLLHHDPAPASAVVLMVEPCSPEAADDLGEGGRLGGQVVDAIAPRASLGVELVETGRQAVVQGLVGEVAAVVGDARREGLPDRGLDRQGAAELLQGARSSARNASSS
jgi:hypothetical protein